MEWCDSSHEQVKRTPTVWCQRKADDLHTQYRFVKDYCIDDKISLWRDTTLQMWIAGLKYLTISKTMIANTLNLLLSLNTYACRELHRRWNKFSLQLIKLGRQKNLVWMRKHLRQFWISNVIWNSTVLYWLTNIWNRIRSYFVKLLPEWNTIQLKAKNPYLQWKQKMIEINSMILF